MSQTASQTSFSATTTNCCWNFGNFHKFPSLFHPSQQFNVFKSILTLFIHNINTTAFLLLFLLEHFSTFENCKLSVHAFITRLFDSAFCSFRYSHVFLITKICSTRVKLNHLYLRNTKDHITALCSFTILGQIKWDGNGPSDI